MAKKRRYYGNDSMDDMNSNRIDNMSRFDNEGERYVGPGRAATGIDGDQANPNSRIPKEQVGVAQYRNGDGRDGRQMINNDRTKIANMPTEIMAKYYPENPSYFPDTEIDDSMRGADQKGKRAYMNPNYIKGRVD